MAAPLFHKLFSSTLTLSCRTFLSQHSQYMKKISFILANPLTKNPKPKTLFGVGTTVGISYAFLGFRFWKQEEEETDALTQLYRNARLAHMRQDFEKADGLYHDALKLADSLVKSKEITEEKFLTARTLLYDGLADIALQTGQIETAETLYKETMKGCLMQGMDQYHNSIVEMSLKLASIYAIRGQKNEAEEGYKFCLNAQIPKMEAKEKLLKAWDETADKSSTSVVLDQSEKDTAALLGMTLSSYGRFLLYEKRYTEALPLFEKARFYAEHTLGKNTNQYIVILNDIATLYIVTKNLDQAEQVLKEGIQLAEKHDLGEKAMLLSNLGAVYLRKGDIQSAINECQLSLQAAKKYDHRMALSMAEKCLKKAHTVLADKKT